MLNSGLPARNSPQKFGTESVQPTAVNMMNACPRLIEHILICCKQFPSINLLSPTVYQLSSSINLHSQFFWFLKNIENEHRLFVCRLCVIQILWRAASCALLNVDAVSLRLATRIQFRGNESQYCIAVILYPYFPGKPIWNAIREPLIVPSKKRFLWEFPSISIGSARNYR